jgi:ribosome modulation factor
MSIPISQQLAYEQGCKANREGKPRWDNPYKVVTKEFKSWSKGWQKAQEDKNNGTD